MPNRNAGRYPAVKDYPLLLVILLLATCLRFNGLNEPGLWLDEISYSIAAQRPILDQILRPTETLGNYLSVDPTLSALPFSLSLSLGRSNFLVRLPAALFGILGVALIYRLGRTLFNNQVGYLAAFLLSISSFHILYSQEARSYTQFVFFCMAAFLFLYRAVLTARVSDWGLYTFFTWAGVSTNHLMIFVVAVQGLFLGIVYIWDQFFAKRGPTRRLLSLRVFSAFTLALIVVFLLRIPWLGDFTQRPCAGCRLGNFSAPLNLGANLERWLQALSGDTAFGLFFLAGLGLIGLTLTLTPLRVSGLLLACWLLASPLVTIAGLWLISQFFHERYTIWGLPAFLILTAQGLVGVRQFFLRSLPPLVFPQSARRAGKVMANGVMGFLLGGIFVASLYRIPQHVQLKQSWPLGQVQEAMALIIAQAEPGEAIVPINLPLLHLQFFTEQSRPDLIYFDNNNLEISRDQLNRKLKGRWYIIHNPDYTRLNRPNEWLDSPDYNEFYSIIVLHLTTSCPLAECVQETKTLLHQLSTANPNSQLASSIDEILAGLERLGF